MFKGDQGVRNLGWASIMVGGGDSLLHFLHIIEGRAPFGLILALCGAGILRAPTTRRWFTRIVILYCGLTFLMTSIILLVAALQHPAEISVGLALGYWLSSIGLGVWGWCALAYLSMQHDPQVLSHFAETAGRTLGIGAKRWLEKL